MMNIYDAYLHERERFGVQGRRFVRTCINTRKITNVIIQQTQQSSPYQLGLESTF